MMLLDQGHSLTPVFDKLILDEVAPPAHIPPEQNLIQPK